MRFVAIDFETANSDRTTICQIGVAIFQNSKLEDQWSTLVDPKSHFNSRNIEVHNITESDVINAPLFSEIFPKLKSLLEDEVVVSHTNFDLTALQQSIEKHNLESINCRWLDSSLVARRAWPQYAKKGYGLDNVAKDLGIEFSHHDALEDARAAGEVLIHAIDHTSIDLEGWLSKIQTPIPRSSGKTKPAQLEPRAEGQDTVVFTGSLTLSRKDATNLAISADYDVGKDISKKTTILVVGDQDLDRLSGHKISSKYRKAEALIQSGRNIEILSESEFKALINMNSDNGLKRYELNFEVEGSKGDSYSVDASVKNNVFKISCTCIGAQRGSHCHHRISLLYGEVDALLSDNEDDVVLLKDMMAGSNVEKYLVGIGKIESQQTELKKSISQVKRARDNAIVEGTEVDKYFIELGHLEIKQTELKNSTLQYKNSLARAMMGLGLNK